MIENNINFEQSQEGQINFLRYFAVCYKNPKIFIFFTLISILISILYAFTRKPLWQGEFQIVLNNESKTDQQFSTAPVISNF